MGIALGLGSRPSSRDNSRISGTAAAHALRLLNHQHQLYSGLKLEILLRRNKGRHGLWTVFDLKRNSRQSDH